MVGGMINDIFRDIRTSLYNMSASGYYDMEVLLSAMSSLCRAEADKYNKDNRDQMDEDYHAR